jgi:glycosyltransferase involved in cell wall biosynthesis
MPFTPKFELSMGRANAQKADVIILTKNSMKPSLPETLASVYANIPVNRLIVVDGGSSDGTAELVGSQRNVVLIDDSKGTRATARQMGIERVETDSFAFVDSDMILQRDWFREAFSLLGPRVGAVSTYPRYFGTAGRVQGALERMYRRPTKRRFDTAAALLRTSAVKGIQIPAEDDRVPSEDEFIGRTVEARGYQVLCVANPVAFHQEDPHRANMVEKGRLLRAKGWRTSRYLLRQLVLSILEGAFIAISLPDPRAGAKRIINSMQTLRGYLRGH